MAEVVRADLQRPASGHDLSARSRCSHAKLSEAEIIERLPKAKGWDRHGDMLVRTWQFPSFRRAMEFVNQRGGPDREDGPPSRHDRELPNGADRDVHSRCGRPDRTLTSP